MSKKIIDIETNGLLESGLDYSAMPYRLREDFKLWMISIRDVEEDEVESLVLEDCTKENLQKALAGCTELIQHNGIAFDLPVLQLLGLLDYTVGYPGESSTLYGEPVVLTDTMLWSKLLDPDRLGGHSLKAWGGRTDNFKGEFKDFSQYSTEMRYYCEQDTSTTLSTYKQLMRERQRANYDKAMQMELKLADLTLKQSLFGFHFDTKLAQECIIDLDQKMKEIADKVNPLLPPRKLTEGEKKFYAAPAKPFKKNGELSASSFNFAEKVKGEFKQVDDVYVFIFDGKEYKYPLVEPLDVKIQSDIDDLDLLKSFLLSLGWNASEWKERDITRNTDKSKKSKTQVQETIERYVKQTFNGYYSEQRCEILGCSHDALSLKLCLEKKASKDKPVWVPTGPKLTIGVDKILDPELEKLGEKAEFVSDVVKYLTYKHRRNSILGGSDPDADDFDEEAQTGFLSFVREDNRIGTPADTMGTNTFRYKHKRVCNLARVSSLYGDKVRALFGAGPGLWQCGWDAASLENRFIGHLMYPYTNGPEVAEMMVADKPNDVHTVNSKKLGVDRSTAKSFSFASIYGAQPPKLAKMLKCNIIEAERMYDAYWDAMLPLRELRDKLEAHWEKNNKKYVLGLDGRLLNARSKHSLINLITQSGGVLFMKYVTVETARLLEELDLLGDPLKHTTKQIKVWMMIAYHDELQYAVHPSLIPVTVYASDEEAKAAQTADSSAIGHGTKGPYLGGKNDLIDCVKQAIESSTARLKIRVPMGMEWNVGKNWRDAH